MSDHPSNTRLAEVPTPSGPTATDFIRALVADDVRQGKHGGRVATRFPPEPNGYLHVGHAKSICLNFGVAQEFGGTCNLRFDDTNPSTEDLEYVESIQRDVRWLGFEWDGLYFASDYFEDLYRFAEELIEAGKAYVDDLSEEEIRSYRGTVTEPGRPSPYRDRPAAESLDLFRRMRAGEFEEGSRVLRAKIDMSAANMKLRDPLLYRIRKVSHYRTGDRWCIYPFYDYAHPLSDALEGITHSLCTLEFENNRDIYDWVRDNTSVKAKPEQTEFARLNISYTLLSKRKLLQLVEGKHVDGWDDPRMPTLSGMRRRGITAAAIRELCDRVGVAKSNSTVDVAQLESAIRDDLNPEVPRVLCVLRPLKVVIENYPEGQVEELEAPYYPHDVPKEGSRALPFSREIFIERDDFAETPPKGFHRLAPGREVRLRYAYFVRLTEVIKNPESGEVVELRCTYDPATRGGSSPEGRKVKGTLHWVSCAHAKTVEVRLYDRLFSAERPDLTEPGQDFRELLNPGSLEVLEGARLEPAAGAAAPGSRFQFERQGYFYLEPESTEVRGLPVFNRIVTLRDTWASRAVEKGEARRDARADEPPSPARSATSAPPRVRTWSPAQQADLARYREMGLSDGDAEVLVDNPTAARFLDEALAGAGGPSGEPSAREVAKWVIHELLRELKDRPAGEIPFGGRELAELAALVERGTLTSTLAKEVFAEMLRAGESPAEIVERKGLRPLDAAEDVAPVVRQVVAEHPAEAAQVRAGKHALLGFFVGQVMKATGARANPKLVRRLLEDELVP